MPPKNEQFSIYPDAADLAVIGANLPRNRAAACNWAIACWARTLRESQPELERAEWNYLADALNGTSLLDAATWTASHLALEVHDAHRLNRLGDKWLPDDPPEADKAALRLEHRIADLTYPQTQYVLLAVRFFWSHLRMAAIDHAVDEWWTVAFRAAAMEAAS